MRYPLNGVVSHRSVQKTPEDDARRCPPFVQRKNAILRDSSLFHVRIWSAVEYALLSLPNSAERLFQLESIGPGSFDGLDCACQTSIAERGNPRGAMRSICVFSLQPYFIKQRLVRALQSW